MAPRICTWLLAVERMGTPSISSLHPIAIDRHGVRAGNTGLQFGNDSIENGAETGLLMLAPFFEELAASRFASPEQADAGSGEPPPIGLAHRIALQNAKPGHDIGDLPEVEIAA